jgi:hypothetical protein
MPRFHGAVGYGIAVENPAESGIWVDDIVEHSYFGDVVRINRKLEPGEKLNDNISVQNSINILADEYAESHFFAIRYVVWAGTRWTVSGVQVQRPRLILTLGDPYNGPLPDEPDESSEPDDESSDSNDESSEGPDSWTGGEDGFDFTGGG